jgi:2-polyprenyl-6-methoxyphenol hydroxylase-like FAD-dependent oxidoreductase
MTSLASAKPLSVAIVGAGIGGMAAAATLRRVGMRVQVYEQANQFARVGAGIQMTPNAMRVLRGLGLERSLRSVAFEPQWAFNRDHDTGVLTNELQVAGVMEERYGAPYLLMHRADLHAALVSNVPADIVNLDRKLVDLTQDAGGVTLRFADRSSTTADIVIGADGVHSRVREIMLGAERPRFTGRVAYRTTFPAQLLDRQVAAARTKWWGSDRHIVIYYVTRNRDEIYFVTSQPEGAEWMTPESWSAKGDLTALRQAFSGFHPDVRAVLDACPEVHKWALLEREPLPTWVHGRVALLGDACHPMTPYMAQGAACALEDAVVLARCLEGAELRTVPQALGRYEASRKPRTSEIQGTARNNTWMRHTTDPSWVYGYDAWTEKLVSQSV